MEEKIIIKSNPIPLKKMLVIFVLAAVILLFISFAIPYINYTTCSKDSSLTQSGMVDVGCSNAPSNQWMLYPGSAEYRFFGKCGPHSYYKTALDYALEEGFPSFPVACAISTCLIAIGILLFLWTKNNEITITDKRVYGRAAFGKRVDLPLDSISAFSYMWPKGISVGSSSGKISFLMLQNRDEIYKCVSDLMIDRQSKAPKAPAATIKPEAPVSNAEELKKYKELLDMGVITQEEFDAKKKQLLGL